MRGRCRHYVGVLTSAVRFSYPGSRNRCAGDLLTTPPASILKAIPTIPPSSMTGKRPLGIKVGMLGGAHYAAVKPPPGGPRDRLLQ